jgi:hypothetical protein
MKPACSNGGSVGAWKGHRSPGPILSRHRSYCVPRPIGGYSSVRRPPCAPWREAADCVIPLHELLLFQKSSQYGGGERGQGLLLSC